MAGPVAQPAVVVIETPVVRVSPLVRVITEPAARLMVTPLLLAGFVPAVMRALRKVPQLLSSLSEVTINGSHPSKVVRLNTASEKTSPTFTLAVVPQIPA